ncbi:DNA-directed DNA polymerase [Metamycoplasma equirhinis]|uniref:DNA polymerase III subunit alpha n=1 Tax=Metamycoplasma equirhinis TaxID=92402 RepID=UPI0025741991|nr:DNA polymerase III subunit alpha [Metamycoplasma equirhinis]BDX52453.1 DNA-directed DNA polymerase [Metamycoplasma equirhinis]
MKLINLHLNTTYSFLESCIQVSEFIDILIKNEQKYFAVTEHSNFFSMGEILKISKQKNLRPIFGLDANVKIDDNLYRFIVFARNHQDFSLLKRLSYKLLSEKFILIEDINTFGNLIWIDHPLFGYYKKTHKFINKNNYYFGILPTDIENNELLRSHFERCLLINHNAILNFDDNKIINVLNSMNKDNEFREIYDEYLPSISNNDKLIIQTNEFAKSLYFDFPEFEFALPKFQNEANIDSSKYLRKLISENFLKKIAPEKRSDLYIKRLNHEFSIIKKLNFEDYFLIIADWVKWAKDNDIAIGPGRGSACGSLISFLIGITNVNPMEYGLIFERFLNPERTSMPDIDIDVQDDRRNEVIQYLNNKYGNENSANIVTFASLGKKSALRDVLRVYEIKPKDIDSISKLISSTDSDILEEFKSNKKFAFELSKVSADSEVIKNILNITQRISGYYRQTGTHAAGLVLSEKPIIEFAPILKIENGMQQTQISMEYLEDFGLIKMDILGLKTLSTIKEILNLIKKTKNINIDLNNISLNDKKTFEILSQANTIGIFQVESPIMMRALAKIGVSNFNDIVAIISLNRPGPMINIPSYAKRKAGYEEIPKISVEYDKIVKDTYGIIIYQEQIMQIAQVVANMTFTEADMFRRIISKKKINEMENSKSLFIKKSVANGYELEIASKIFDSIEKFADYGFNKSHAVSYAILTYQMAYLKGHYPLEFYAACISSAHGAHDTISKCVNEAKKMSIKVISPDIMISEENAIIKDNAIILPLNMVKGVGPEIVRSIVANRNANNGYINFLHMLLCLNNVKSVGMAAIKTLIEASAMRNFGYNQATLLNEIEHDNDDTLLFVKYNKNKPASELIDTINKYKPNKIIEQNQKLEQENEENLLGQNYNLIGKYNFETQGNRLADLHIGNEYVLTVLCTSIKYATAKTGKQYILLKLQDSSQNVFGYIWNANETIFNEWKELKDKPVEVKVIKKTGDNLTIKEWKRK